VQVHRGTHASLSCQHFAHAAVVICFDRLTSRSVPFSDSKRELASMSKCHLQCEGMSDVSHSAAMASNPDPLDLFMTGNDGQVWRLVVARRRPTGRETTTI
jgi:hypothetical protein